MFMEKLGTFASTKTTLLRKTSSLKRKKMKGKKKELHLPLSNLCGKNIDRDKNKYMNK